MALLSLFDGSGFARLVLGEILASLGCPGALVASSFAEIGDDLAEAVARHWAERARLTGEVPHRRLVGDVWNLLRGSPTPLEAFARTLPLGCLVLEIAGSPCQQLTWSGMHQGTQGLRGTYSILFFAGPAVARALQRLKPDARCTSSWRTLRARVLCTGTPSCGRLGA